MRHKKRKKIISRGVSHRKALIQSLAKSLIIHGKISTTNTKAKIVRSYVERLITTGKNDNLSSRRKLIRKLNSNKLAHKVIKDISPRYKNRAGGYTKIIKIGRRKGDGAPLVYITFS